jgi:CrcB protein
MLRSLLIVGGGSFVGGALRYLVMKLVPATTAHPFPLGTFLVNILGCLVIGLLYALMERYRLLSPDLRLFLTVGFCGGFTTFSTFVNDSFTLFRGGLSLIGLAYIAASVIVGLVMLYAGYALVKLL